MPTTINQVYFRKWSCVAGFSIHKRQKMNRVAKSEMKRNSENTLSCKRIIFVAYGSTVIKALRRSKCPNLTQIGRHIWRIYGFVYQDLRCVFSFCFYASLYPVLFTWIPFRCVVSQDPPRMESNFK